jgi:GT2 family glycosyltransferase
MSDDKVIVVPPSRPRAQQRTPQPTPAGAPLAAAGTNLASILIPCCGQLEYTRLCVPAILAHTRRPYELLFLDIASLDGTAEYLAGLAAACSSRVAVFRAATDADLPAVIGQALAEAHGEYLVLLNNDTVVSDGWLGQLIALASLSFGVGLVGPMSNYAAPPQLVEVVPYRSGPRQGSGRGLLDRAALDAFARQHREEHRGQWQHAERLGGFCLLLKREVLGRIGPLHDEAGLGLFDTDLLSVKARQAGYSLAVCKDLFVHHFGTRTFAHGASPAAPG